MGCSSSARRIWPPASWDRSCGARRSSSVFAWRTPPSPRGPRSDHFFVCVFFGRLPPPPPSVASMNRFSGKSNPATVKLIPREEQQRTVSCLEGFSRHYGNASWVGGSFPLESREPKIRQPRRNSNFAYPEAETFNGRPSLHWTPKTEGPRSLHWTLRELVWDLKA